MPAPAADNLRVVDLSHPISPGMPVWPGSPAPELGPLATIRDDGFAEQSIRISSHTGTHLDAPAHMIEGGATLDSFPAGHFFGRAALVDARCVSTGRIGLSLLEPNRDAISSADFLLLHTGWANFWGGSAYDSGYPVLDDAAAAWIAGIGLRCVGIDAPSVDPADSDAFPVHRRLLGSGLLLAENLTNLHLLPPGSCALAIFPLPVRGAEACPARAVAFL